MLTKEIKAQLLASLKSQDWDVFKMLRYTYGEEGAVFFIEDMDLSNAQLGQLPSDFLCFKNCNLTNASFQGKQFWPVSLWSCMAQDIDLSDSWGMLMAFDCDLRGARFNCTTDLFPANTDLPSTFDSCLLDEKFITYAKQHGLLLAFPPDQHQYYAFGHRRPTLLRNYLHK